MKRLLLVALGALGLAATAHAQANLSFVDSILVHSDAPATVDRPLYRVFGFSAGYTDTIDFQLPVNREREVPAFPPASFYALFDAQNTPAWIDRDIRGVPDSVASLAASRFSLRYVFDVQRATGQVVTFVMPRALPTGIDSINFRDVIGGTGGLVFNETITAGPDSVAIPNNALTKVAMIVYYNASVIPTGVDDETLPSIAGLRMAPNPATDQLAVTATLPAGARLLVSDIRGVLAIDDRVETATDRAMIAVDELEPGVYVVRAVAPDGSLLASDRFVIAR